MALALGTNCGFVSVAPTTDPVGDSSRIIDGRTVVTRDTSPLTAATVTEVGWWCDNATEASNFEVGVYAADGAVVPGEAGTLLHVSRTNAKGTTSGWKVVTGLSWAISASTTYWIAVQLDNVATQTNLDSQLAVGNGVDTLSAQTTLVDPLGGGTLPNSTEVAAIYAVWSASGASGPANLKTYNTNVKANIKSINTNLIANVKSLNTNV